MANVRVDQLITYPIKSLRGVNSDHVLVRSSGFEADRRWMIVDAEGTSVTQREHPILSQCEVGFQGEYIKVKFDGDEIWVPIQPGALATSVGVTIWGERVEALAAPDEIGDWFTSLLGFSVSLVYMRDDAFRKVNPAYAGGVYRTAFTDGYPVLVASTSSLEDLNGRLAEPVPMSRFRPNIVVSGAPPFDEDYWGEVQTGDVTIRGVKPCSRCTMTTIDAETGRKGKEPLKTLASFRKWGNHVYFAENFVIEKPGMIHVGDHVDVRSRRSSTEVARTRA